MLLDASQRASLYIYGGYAHGCNESDKADPIILTLPDLFFTSLGVTVWGRMFSASLGVTPSTRLRASPLRELQLVQSADGGVVGKWQDYGALIDDKYQRAVYTKEGLGWHPCVIFRTSRAGEIDLLAVLAILRIRD